MLRIYGNYLHAIFTGLLFLYPWKGGLRKIIIQSTNYYTEQLVDQSLLFKIFIRYATANLDFCKPQVVYSF